MSGDKTIPSQETLRAERKQIKDEIAEDRALIARSKARVAEAQELVADSFDRLAKSQHLILLRAPMGR